MAYNFQYPSFLRSSRPYPKWHRAVHLSYLVLMVILAILLPLLHGYRIKGFNSVAVFTTIGLMLLVYVLYWLWLRFWYQRNYQHPLLSLHLPGPTAASSDPTSSATQHSYPTFASLRNHAIAAHIPLTLRVGDAIIHPVPPTPPVPEWAVDIGARLQPPPPTYITGMLGVNAPPPYEDGTKVRGCGNRSASSRAVEEAVGAHMDEDSVVGRENMGIVVSRGESAGSATYHDEQLGRLDGEARSGNAEES